MLAALAEQVRGGILLFICVIIGGFFFLDATYNIFGKKAPGADRKKSERGDTICFSVLYKNKIYGEDTFLTLAPEKAIRVGCGPDCHLDLSGYPLPIEMEQGVWFQVLKNSAGVLMVLKDPAMDGLRCRDLSDKEYRALGRALFRDAMQVEKDGIVIRMEKEA